MGINSDSKTKVDLLDRRGFAYGIAQGIIQTAKSDLDGFAVGITGKWGSGKSTLLDFVKEDIIKLSLENEIENVIIEFNPWVFTDEENIKKAFLKTFALSISNKPRSLWTKNSKTVYKLAKAGAGKLGGEIGKDILDLIQGYIENESSSSYKDLIDKFLISSQKKVFIFIDDIDRLLPKQIFDVLQVLKLSGNFKNTYYIVAFDREAVEVSIESQFKNYGRKFLDKIIQADFLIPEISNEKIENIFFDELDKILKDLGLKYSKNNFISVWSYKGFKNYFKTLREVYRYFNSLKLRLPSICNDINITDFLVIEGIRLYDFVAYEIIYQAYRFKLMSISNSRPNWDETLSLPSTLSLVKFLFPDSRLSIISSDKNDKRLSNPEYFDRYFTLKINSFDVGEQDLSIIVEEREARLSKLEFLLVHNRLRNLLRRLTDKNLLEHYPYWDFSLIMDLFDFFDTNASRLIDLDVDMCDAILNLLDVKEDKRNVYHQLFVNHLVMDVNRVSNARAYFAHYIIVNETLQTGFADNFVYIKKYFKQNIDPIRNFYFRYLKEWQGYFLKQTIPVDDIYTSLFIIDFATYEKKMYQAYAVDLILDKKALLFYLRLFVYQSEARFYIRRDIVRILLPNDLLENFTNSLNNLSDGEIAKEQIMCREFFLANINNKAEE